MSAIKLQAVEKWFGDVQVIKGVDLEISNGEFVVFVGPSDVTDTGDAGIGIRHAASFYREC